MKINYNAVFLVLLMILAGIAAYSILKSFLAAILLGFLISRFFNGWYRGILKKTGQKKALSALTACLLVFLLFVIPLIFFIGLVILQATQFCQGLDYQEIQQKLSSLAKISWVENFLKNFNFRELLESDQLAGGIKNFSNFLLGALSSTYQGTANFIFMIFVMFFSLYYFFKDGNKFIEKFAELSPLRDEQVKKLLKKFLLISKATLKGSLVIALIQGILMGLLFWVSGIAAPAFWALVTVFAAFIPAVGVGIIWAPAGIIMLFSGHLWQGILILSVGVVLISLVDNFLRPRLVGGSSSLHPLLVFLSTIGGLAVFGILGLLWGPIIVSLFIALLEIYRDELGEKIDEN